MLTPPVITPLVLIGWQIKIYKLLFIIFNILLSTLLFSPQGYCICGECCGTDAPGVDGNEVSGGEKLCAQRLSSSKRPSGQPTLRQNQWLWTLQGPGSRWQLLQGTMRTVLRCNPMPSPLHKHKRCIYHWLISCKLQTSHSTTTNHTLTETVSS